MEQLYLAMALLISGNQLVSYTRQMDLMLIGRIGDQAKFSRKRIFKNETL